MNEFSGRPRASRPSAGVMLISSLQNERIKAIRALEMRKARRETGLFVAEGTSILMTARDKGWVAQTLLYEPVAGDNPANRSLVADAMAAGTEVLEVTPAVLGKVAAKDNPQAILGVFRQRWADAPDATALSASDLWLVLEEIRDPGNLGTIMRTVDAVGACGIILVGATCDPFAREATRASMGSIFAVPLVRMERAAFLALATSWTGDIVGLHLAATHDFRTGPYHGPTLVLMGSEGPGLSDELTATATRLVRIPMAGDLDSLNLAIAAALTLYEIQRPYLRVSRE
ncbi:MAG: RNA methyltransferase [Hyphomicrobiaceae bacterium]|nr:RNA methyltransferase [Hyphomicrobiaceae bacterium]